MIVAGLNRRRKNQLGILHLCILQERLQQCSSLDDRRSNPSAPWSLPTRLPVLIPQNLVAVVQVKVCLKVYLYAVCQLLAHAAGLACPDVQAVRVKVFCDPVKQSTQTCLHMSSRLSEAACVRKHLCSHKCTGHDPGQRLVCLLDHRGYRTRCAELQALECVLTDDVSDCYICVVCRARYLAVLYRKPAGGR